MKVKRGIIKSMVLFVFTVSLCFYGCQTETIEDTKSEESLNLKAAMQIDEAVKIDKLLADLKPTLDNVSKTLGVFEVMTFEVVKNFETGEIYIENLKSEPFVGIDRQYKSGYQVDCDLGGSGDWSESCNGTYSCGGLIKKCLDAGGCATTCANKSSEGHFGSVKINYLIKEE
jgi:hypothetical protein